MSPVNATATATIQAPIQAASPTEIVRPTILVIEDYSDTRELLAALFQRRGYNVIEAEDGVEGLLKAGWLYPDLIIMDLSLPEMDGVEAARRIHAQAKLSQIPIFVVSAYLTEAVKADVRAAGCVEIFSKPFDAETLLDKVAAALANESLGRPAK
jgi:CheY-like chemotaxis protein